MTALEGVAGILAAVVMADSTEQAGSRTAPPEPQPEHCGGLPWSTPGVSAVEIVSCTADGKPLYQVIFSLERDEDAAETGALRRRHWIVLYRGWAREEGAWLPATYYRVGEARADSRACPAVLDLAARFNALTPPRIVLPDVRDPPSGRYPPPPPVHGQEYWVQGRAGGTDMFGPVVTMAGAEGDHVGWSQAVIYRLDNCWFPEASSPRSPQ